MADASNLNDYVIPAGPYGVMNRHKATLKVSAVDFSADDTIYVTRLPKGMYIDQVEMVITDASNASVTGAVGHAQKGSGDWTDDDDFFISANALNAKAYVNSLNNTKHKGLRIDKDEVYLTLTIAGADISEATEIDFFIQYVWEGGL